MGSGRVSPDDVEQALAYQRENGGFFGEALVACGFVSEGEVEWGLASQYDLPYVFPQAEAVDYQAASLVSPEWALAHLTLPIMRTQESLTVITDSPLKTEPVEELRARTQLDIQLALASSSTIRELIREVYARSSAADEEAPGGPIELTRALDMALGTRAPRFGISSRGTTAWAWWDDAGTIRRRPLMEDWQAELERTIAPAADPGEAGSSPARWSARLSRAGTVTPIRVHFLVDESGCEYLFSARDAEATPRGTFPPPPPGVVSEVRLLARTGKARLVVTAEPVELGHRLLPHLPDLMFEPGWRSIYVHTEGRPGELEVFSRELSDDPRAWSSELEALRAFHFDVVAVDLDLEHGDADWADAALDVASVAFVLWPRGDLETAREAGIRWHLHVARASDDELEWRLEPLHV